MTATLHDLDRLVEPLRERVSRLAARLLELAGDHVVGWTLFGASTTGAFNARLHRVHSALVVERFDLGELYALAQALRPWLQGEFNTPLVMTQAFIAASCDSFPLELLEIQQQHCTILGVDEFAALRFDRDHVRLQCERELKSLQMALRQRVLMSSADGRAPDDLASPSADGILRVLRGVLWLRGTRLSKPAAEVVSEIERVVGRGCLGLRHLLAPGHLHGEHVAAELHRDLLALSELSDVA